MTIGERLETLYRLAGAEGANRPGLSDAEEAAHQLVAGWMREAGLTVDRDAAGNLYGRRLGEDPTLPEIWIGSHLDTVPDGGRYDGALGVLVGLDAVQGLPSPLPRTVTVVAFRDEEGVRFGHGFFGSRAVTGTVDADTLERSDAEGVTVRDALTRLGLELEGDGDGAWLVAPPAAYVEVHIEQGPVLAAADAPVGVVDSIAGIAELEITFRGQEGHAGTTPMHLRRDAGLCAAAFQVEIAARARRISGAVATVGRVALAPGAGNVVPRAAKLVVDARAPDAEKLDQLERAVLEAADRAATDHRCSVEVTRAARVTPVRADAAVVGALDVAASGAPHLPSGAGHDAQVLGSAGVPMGMLFVRSLAEGISHSPREHTAEADIAVAVDVITRALPELCDRIVS